MTSHIEEHRKKIQKKEKKKTCDVVIHHKHDKSYRNCTQNTHHLLLRPRALFSIFKFYIILNNKNLLQTIVAIEI